MSDASLAERSIELVRTWIDPTRAPSVRSGRGSADAGQHLAALLWDPAGLRFTVQFIDRVIRPEDPATAAHALQSLAPRVPAFLSGQERRALRFGARASRLAPDLVQRRAHKKLHELVDHLVLDATSARLGASIADLTRTGDRLNLSLLGEAVLGEGEAMRHRDRVLDLVRREDVDYVSVKVSSIASQLNPWSFDATVQRIVDRLQPIYAEAELCNTFVNLDMEEHGTVDLTVAAFTRALEEFPELEAGIAIQAYLPGSLATLEHLQEWAAQRRAAGGAPIKVRIVKGANLALEATEAELRGWPLATWHSKADTDAHYKRLIDWALTPERVHNVRIGVASQNLFDLAHAWLLAGDRDVRDDVEFEALLGFDGGPLRAAREDLGPLRLYTPVVAPAEFDAALAYLVRRLQESASPGNFLVALPELNHPGVFDREADQFRTSLASAGLDPAGRGRGAELAHRHDGFVNTPDTNPAHAANRDWAERIASRSQYTALGEHTVQLNRLMGPASLQSLIGTVRDGGRAWNDRSTEVRSWTLHQAGRTLESRRPDLIAVMMAETGKTFAEADTEVSEAVDFAHYYAEELLRLSAVDGARFEPARLTVVTPPWNFPVAIPAGGVLAALAAGSGVILKPAPQSPRCAAIVVEALREAGVPREALALAVMDEGELSQSLVTHPDVDRVILTGSWDTARLFRSWRPELPLMAETSGKNAIVVTPSADRDRAVADIVRSAFGNAGQKCSAASLAILVGPVGTSERFLRQLADATSSLTVGMPDDLSTTVGPLIGPAGSPLNEALTAAPAGETWLVEPKQLDDVGRLWSPGVRLGVQPGSDFHTTEFFGPVLGIMHAPTLADAIAWQNGTKYGLTAGLHSLDPDEVRTWLAKVEAGNLYVNRPITGAVVRRQPFGGWKRSSVGATAKAGGPNYLAHLGTWRPAPLRATSKVELASDVSKLLQLFAAHLDEPARAFLRAAATSDQRAWDGEFGVAKDVSRLAAELNVLRYLPAEVTIRSGGSFVPLARVLLAAKRAGARVHVSSAAPLPRDVEHTVETSEEWLQRVADTRPARIRLVGADAASTAAAVDGDPDVALYGGPVTSAGRVELLPFLREQAVSITTHRYGIPDTSLVTFVSRK
ncbi:MAG TPA: bifunctional proline dehydrogenase/L-glutamate gamma-semialdehyde dehydrogenase [Aeromicrobium sp.]|nr:bifunctional proline dehydrogenase/L-glutamate gamma-semialdehyde dehydrogenase [Aeromicrobium sp.]HKY58402.1 bifunctional proline dehydrogenase/L-glutamate gamma-semialdehyde dehydrogenase [Aeromicrobium sp.]